MPVSHTTPWSGSKSPLIRFSNWSVFAVSGSDAIIYYRNIIRDLNSSSCLILFFILLLYLGGDKAFLTGRQHCMYLPWSSVNSCIMTNPCTSGISVMFNCLSIYSILLFNQFFKHPLICNLSIFIKFWTHHALKNCTSQFIVLWRTQLNCKSLICESHSTVNSHLLLSVATHSEIQRLDRPNNPVGIDEYELKTKEIPNNQSYSKFWKIS